MIDIIIPAYNCKNTIRKTLASLESQTCQNFNVIVVDDNSEEDFTEIIKEKQKVLNLTYIKKQFNEGCGLARQTGIDNATSEYLAFLDADDVLMPYAVEVWDCMYKSNPDIDVFHSYFYEQFLSDEPSLLLHQRGYTWMHGKLYKKTFLDKYNIRFHPETMIMEDSYFNSICSELGKIAEIQIPMYLWISNPNSITRINGSPFKRNCLPEFVHAMYLSTKFLLDNNVKKIMHLEGTLHWIDEYIKKGNKVDKNTWKELEYIIKIYKKGDEGE